MKNLKTITILSTRLFFLMIIINGILTSCCGGRYARVSTYAGNGTPGNSNGSAATATFKQPVDVGVDGEGNIYVADMGNNLIRKIATNHTVSLHYDWGARPSGGFVEIRNLDADNHGRLFVIDDDNLSLRKIEGGTTTTITGFRRDDEYYYNYLSHDGGPDSASFFYLEDLTLNASDDLLNVVDRINSSLAIRHVTMDGFVTTMRYPAGNKITMDGFDNIYVSVGTKVVKISAAGAISDLAGGNTPGYADGTGGDARFNGITSIDADAKGNIYVSDGGNNRVRKISTNGVVTTLAGNGTAGFADGKGANAQFKDLRGIVVYKCAVYVADMGNNRIRKITIPK